MLAAKLGVGAALRPTQRAPGGAAVLTLWAGATKPFSVRAFSAPPEVGAGSTLRSQTARRPRTRHGSATPRPSCACGTKRGRERERGSERARARERLADRQTERERAGDGRSLQRRRDLKLAVLPTDRSECGQAPKPPLNAYLRFTMAKRPELKQQNLGATDVMRLLAKMWREAPPAEVSWVRGCGQLEWPMPPFHVHEHNK